MNDAVKQWQTLRFMSSCVWDKKPLRISRLKQYRSKHYCAILTKGTIRWIHAR